MMEHSPCRAFGCYAPVVASMWMVCDALEVSPEDMERVAALMEEMEEEKAWCRRMPRRR